jgi:hypothetical protein
MIKQESTYNADCVARWLAVGNQIKREPARPLYPSQEKYLSELDALENDTWERWVL